MTDWDAIAEAIEANRSDPTYRPWYAPWSNEEHTASEWVDIELDNLRLRRDYEDRREAGTLTDEERAGYEQAESDREAEEETNLGADGLEWWWRAVEEERRSTVGDKWTGWTELDKLLGRPMRAGEVILFAARPGVGKSWFLQCILEHELERGDGIAGESAMLCQLEMSDHQQGERFGVHALGVTPHEAAIRARLDLTKDAMLDTAPHLFRLMCFDRIKSVEQIPALIAETERRRGRPSIVGIDYHGLLDGKGQSRYEIVSNVSRRLKEIAKAENVLILCAVQLSRAGKDGSTIPALDSMRDSGVIEEAADRIVGLWRKPVIVEEGTEGFAPSRTEGSKIGLVILKNRLGSTGGESTLVYDHTLRLVEPEVVEDDGLPW